MIGGKIHKKSWSRPEQLIFENHENIFLQHQYFYDLPIIQHAQKKVKTLYHKNS